MSSSCWMKRDIRDRPKVLRVVRNRNRMKHTLLRCCTSEWIRIEWNAHCCGAARQNGMRTHCNVLEWNESSLFWVGGWLRKCSSIGVKKKWNCNISSPLPWKLSSTFILLDWQCCVVHRRRIHILILLWALLVFLHISCIGSSFVRVQVFFFCNDHRCSICTILGRVHSLHTVGRVVRVSLSLSV